MGNGEEHIALIDRLQPALTGTNARERLSLFFAAALVFTFAVGLMLGFNSGMLVEKDQRLLLHAVLLLSAFVCAAIAALCAHVFLKTFNVLLRSLNSSKESQKVNRTSHNKSSRDLQAKQPENTM